MKVVVLSDIHGNADALDAALSAIGPQEFDHMVILGDLLTYGVQGNRVLERVEELCRDPRTVLIEGNHDYMYRKLCRKESAYYDTLPAWLRECIDHVRASTDTERLLTLPFLNDVVLKGVLFAHANPYGVPNWKYLNGLNAKTEAVKAIAGRGLRMGVFGHTHRAALTIFRPPRCRFTLGRSLTDIRCIAPSESGLLDAGSVGQSRDGIPGAVHITLTLGDSDIAGHLQRTQYDTAPIRRELANAPLLPDTVNRLLAYIPIV